MNVFYPTSFVSYYIVHVGWTSTELRSDGMPFMETWSSVLHVLPHIVQ